MESVVLVIVRSSTAEALAWDSYPPKFVRSPPQDTVAGGFSGFSCQSGPRGNLPRSVAPRSEGKYFRVARRATLLRRLPFRFCLLVATTGRAASLYGLEFGAAPLMVVVDNLLIVSMQKLLTKVASEWISSLQKTKKVFEQLWSSFNSLTPTVTVAVVD